MRKYLAEFIAVFFLVFVGAGSIIADQYLVAVRVTDSFGLLGIALAHGLALAAAVAAVLRISGGHVNPAISIAAWISRRLSGKDLIGYVVGQALGGISAALILRQLTPDEASQEVGVGVPALGVGVGPLEGIALEVVLTFFLAFTIWGVAVDRKGPRAIAPLAIGLVVTFDILAGGPFTGAAMNPARWLGPAVASGQFADAVVWTVGPILGALLGALVYENFFLADQPPPQVPEEEEEEEEEEWELEEEAELEERAAPPRSSAAYTPPPPSDREPPPPPPPERTEPESYRPPPPPPEEDR